MDVQFEHLSYLHLLWGVPLLALVYLYGFVRKGRGLRRFATINLFNQLMPAVSLRKQKLKAVLVLAALALLIVGATGPKWGKSIVNVERRGIDLMVCLDVSRSMLAEDLKPNRMERAKLELADVLSVMHGDRVGLVTFAGNASLACPLTINYGAYRLALDEVTTRSVSRGGSLIGDAVRLAAASFADKAKGHKAILVITDGEDQESFPVEAARTAFRDQGVRIFTVGLGNLGQGARVPVEENGQRQYLQYKGEEVWSRMDRKVLEEMAVEGGGACFPAATTDPDFVAYYDVIRAQVEARELESSRRELYHPQFQWFAGAALVLLVVEMLLSDRRRVAAEAALRQAA